MDDIFRLRASVYAAASEFYRTHLDYLAELRDYGQVSTDVWKRCIDKGEVYRGALRSLLVYLSALPSSAPDQVAISSTAHLIDALESKLKQIRPAGDQSIAPAPTKRKQLSIQPGKLLQFPRTEVQSVPRTANAYDTPQTDNNQPSKRIISR